jgi:dienelactone hydrolase
LDFHRIIEGEVSLRDVQILAKKHFLQGTLSVPKDAKGIVLFVHGSGSGRFSPRNQVVAKKMQESGFATLLMDLLTKEEEDLDTITRQFRFDIELLTERLIGCTEWLKAQPELQGLAVFYFGASTGAAAALQAAARLSVQQGFQIKAVVSRGGRPDLAAKELPLVQAATLFIVGGQDFGVIELNQEAYKLLKTKKKFEIIEGATHLFEEPGALEKVAEASILWFSM